MRLPHCHETEIGLITRSECNLTQMSMHSVSRLLNSLAQRPCVHATTLARGCWQHAARTRLEPSHGCAPAK
eukprot:6189630-Pleurochrysis_carterae.AAC.1